MESATRPVSVIPKKHPLPKRIDKKRRPRRELEFTGEDIDGDNKLTSEMRGEYEREFRNGKGTRRG